MVRSAIFYVFALIHFSGFVVCPPVTQQPPVTTTEKIDDKEEIWGLEYERYLKEVVGILESDEIFRKKLEESNISDIKTGEIAKHLDFVGHGIRSQLDELKRKEIDRLRQVLRLKSYLQNGLNASHPDVVINGAADKDRILAHLDHENPDTFEVSDLAKLIQRATKDLDDIDQKRKSDFKNYEMEKEHDRREELKKLDEDERAKEEKKYEEMEKKHDDHPKLNHPGNEEQLKEVWEETDGLDKKEFDPKTFFHLHDTNGDGFLDVTEVEALFQQELDKVYDPNAPEDDMMERYEEMNRMREHLVNEVDRNKDKLISLDEFVDSTKTEEFKKDEEWEPIEKEDVFSDKDLEAFEEKLEDDQQAREDKGHPPVRADKDHLQRGQEINEIHVMKQQMNLRQPAHELNQLPEHRQVQPDESQGRHVAVSSQPPLPSDAESLQQKSNVPQHPRVDRL